MTDLSPSLCGLAILGFIADGAQHGGVSVEEIYRAVPSHTRQDAIPGQIDGWPNNVSEWVDEIQSLLDRSLIQRVAFSDRFVYVLTQAGLCIVRSSLHPRAQHPQEILA